MGRMGAGGRLSPGVDPRSGSLTPWVLFLCGSFSILPDMHPEGSLAFPPPWMLYGSQPPQLPQPPRQRGAVSVKLHEFPGKPAPQVQEAAVCWILRAEGLL